jgi:hypothetical protein
MFLASFPGELSCPGEARLWFPYLIAMLLKNVRASSSEQVTPFVQ